MSKKKLDLDQMSYTEAVAWYQGSADRMLWRYIFWFFFVFVMSLAYLMVGLVLMLLTAIYFYVKYHDKDAQSSYDTLMAAIEAKRVQEGIPGNESIHDDR